MDDPRKDEREIRGLFSTARRADRESVPDFASMKADLRKRARRSTSTRALRFAVMTSTATVAVAAMTMWIAGKSPTAVVPEAPRAERLSGGIEVSVRDEAGQPLPGATVTISHETGFVKTAANRTDRQGQSVFPVLREGTGYAIHVSHPGFAPVRQVGLTVPQGESIEVPVQLATEVAEPVKVASVRCGVDTGSTETASPFTQDFVSDLPVPPRFVQTVVTAAPGSVTEESGVAPVAHGARERHFEAMVGGVRNEGTTVLAAGSSARPTSMRKTVRILVPGPFTEQDPGFNTEAYSPIQENEFLSALENPLSTFSIDVDTGSYANVRRFLNRGELPPRDAVRIEEMINYFNYDYPLPDGDAPFSVNVEIADCPWSADHRLARIGLKGRRVSRGDLAGSNLVFLIDVSGSMRPPNKLPLLKSALSLLVDQLDGRDQVALVIYAGAAEVILPSTPGDGRGEIRNALDRLGAGGSTNGGRGIEMAYEIARENFIPGGVNRVILATDGDFNVGVTDDSALLESIEKEARAGIFLTTLGFGMGNYKDDMLERLADRGNGNYAYIDNLREARKVLVEEVGGTLVTIAKDVKIQVEFNPLQVGGYRLIGYENRMLAKEDFNDDRKDAGEIGAGHTVTALYEIVPAGEELPVAAVDPLKYRKEGQLTEAAENGELFTLKLRYKEPDADTGKLLSFPVVDEGRSLASASEDFKFAGAIACFGMILRESPYADVGMLDQVRTLALDGNGSDESGYRAELLHLVDIAVPLLQERRDD